MKKDFVGREGAVIHSNLVHQTVPISAASRTSRLSGRLGFVLYVMSFVPVALHKGDPLIYRVFTLGLHILVIAMCVHWLADNLKLVVPAPSAIPQCIY